MQRYKETGDAGSTLGHFFNKLVTTDCQVIIIN
jgi:hypothetical protein